MWPTDHIAGVPRLGQQADGHPMPSHTSHTTPATRKPPQCSVWRPVLVNVSLCVLLETQALCPDSSNRCSSGKHTVSQATLFPPSMPFIFLIPFLLSKFLPPPFLSSTVYPHQMLADPKPSLASYKFSQPLPGAVNQNYSHLYLTLLPAK